jgi:hypothetical protein
MQLQSDRSTGLSTEQVKERLQTCGANELQETPGRPRWQSLLDQFTNIMLIMLIAVAIVSGFLDFKKGQFPKDAIAIFAIVILNGVLGYFQESRAEQALAALKRLTPLRVRALRDGKEIEVDYYENTSFNIFDPLSATNQKQLWHRGYPIEALQKKNNILYLGKKKITPLIQADLWDGDPDIDAICRLSKKPIVKFEQFKPFGSNQLAPFNSQNTFIAREAIPYYTVLPHTGRMDDIWGSYIAQFYFPQSVIYNQATVYQDRNVQDLVTNLENEVIGYRNTLKMLNDLSNFETYLPEKAKTFWKTYRKQF